MSKFELSMNKVEFSKSGLDVIFYPDERFPKLIVHTYDGDCAGGYDNKLVIKRYGHKFKFTYDYFNVSGDCENKNFTKYDAKEVHEIGICDYANFNSYTGKFFYMKEILEFIHKSGFKF